MAINTQALKAARSASGLTQWDLAEAIGKDPSTVAHMERCRLTPSDETIAQIAAALGVEPEALLITPDAEAECLATITGEAS